MNTPFSVETAARRIVETRVPRDPARWLRIGSWSVQGYAHLVGLDSRWQMFGRQSRFSWRYIVTGEYENHEAVLLPLPRQSPRSGWQDLLFDFREAKFMLNLYQSREDRRGWAYSLCREYSTRDGSPIRSVRIDLEVQQILQPAEARVLGTHLSPEITRAGLDIFPCPLPH